MNKDEVEANLSAMIEEVETTRQNLANGDTSGLEDIGDRVAVVCRAATALPEVDAVAVHPLLEQLRDDLTKLSSEIDQINAAGTEVPSSPTHHRSRRPPLVSAVEMERGIRPTD